jgi:Flp pilus assembly protein TadG
LLKQFRGAVAPTVALSLFALIGIGGIAFDYARLASMDTELQNAADQAALAAASQLDGEVGAMARANAAAQSLLTNQTRFANDNVGADIGDISLTFYTGYDRVADTFGAIATTDAEAKVVSVSIGGREAFYALTPVVVDHGGGSCRARGRGMQSAATDGLQPQSRHGS